MIMFALSDLHPSTLISWASEWKQGKKAEKRGMAKSLNLIVQLIDDWK